MASTTVAKKDASQVSIKGMTLAERKFLQEIRSGAHKTWQDAAKASGITPRQSRAMFKNPEFKKEFDTFFDAEEIRITERELVFSSGDVVGLLDEAKTAYKDQTIEDVECPQCGHKFSVVGKVRDWVTSLKAIELISKMAGLVKNQSSLEVKGGVSMAHFDMSTAQAMALGALKHGRAVPPGIYKELQDLADQFHFDLPALPVAVQAIDAEFKVVEVGKNEAEDNS